MLFLFFLLNLFHPIHVAVTEIEYKASAKTLQITHKIFTDDLEKHLEALAKKSGKDIRLQIGTPKEHPLTDDLLKNYLETHFLLKINGKAFPVKYLGKEQETEATWIYMEIENIKNPKKFQLTDTILLDLLEDQQNLVHFKVSAQKKSLRFRRGETSEMWEL